MARRKELTHPQIEEALQYHDVDNFIRMIKFNEAAMIRTDNTTGIRGVTKSSSGTFATNITVAGNIIYLGTYKTIDEAAEVIRAARERLIRELRRRVKLAGKGYLI